MRPRLLVTHAVKRAASSTGRLGIPLLLTVAALAAVPAPAAAQTTTQVVEYYHTDAIGSVRAVTKQVNGVWEVTRHDFMPFGEEVSPQNPPQDKRLFIGKERDAETAMDYVEARYLRSVVGRFTTVDPAQVSARSQCPQSWNRYAYSYNNPLKYRDVNGRWPQSIHNQIIDAAFPGLSARQRETLKSAGRFVDRPANQTKAGNHQHAMRSPDENPHTASKAITQVIRDNEARAERLQGSQPQRTSNINDRSLFVAGEAFHTVMDRVSPTHTGPDGMPLPSSGIPLGKKEAEAMQEHMNGEAEIRSTDMATAVNAVQESFAAVYGTSAAAMATTPAATTTPEKVKK